MNINSHHMTRTRSGTAVGSDACCEPQRGRTTARMLAAVAFAGLFLAGWGPSTYYDHRTGWVFDATGTPLDCAAVARHYPDGGYWHGLAGGRMSVTPDQKRNIAREVCFPTRGECEYWLTQMSGALTRMTSGECRAGGER